MPGFPPRTIVVCAVSYLFTCDCRLSPSGRGGSQSQPDCVEVNCRKDSKRSTELIAGFLPSRGMHTGKANSECCDAVLSKEGEYLLRGSDTKASGGRRDRC